MRSSTLALATLFFAAMLAACEEEKPLTLPDLAMADLSAARDMAGGGPLGCGSYVTCFNRCPDQDCADECGDRLTADGEQIADQLFECAITFCISSAVDGGAACAND